ncbi:hypothetical protein [Jannaschia pohangensis]|uniref:Uncharacterized protein n=1 Tax=Jannaschia pohangensis TaxID=390807 RepID=A0A1I3J269_9RHOB|nr:hypothetical protein [Jannaschia pohangensis]SFI54372.1 hypothetical protein SAMN04488095_1183 [Jannaschia pohangensis]
MKLTGPIIAIVLGVAVASIPWIDHRYGQVTHNIGAGIARGVGLQILAVIGGGAALVGAIILLVRALDRP